MSAAGLLAMPSLFSGPARAEPTDIAEEYLGFADRFRTPLKQVRGQRARHPSIAGAGQWYKA
jgi:hypothetical protein